jgi:hypothetical protein
MKLQWARDRLCDAILILKKYIRCAFIVGGNQGLRYVTAALIGGILEEFMDPDSVLPIETDTAGTIDTGARAPMQILDILIKKVKQEGLNYTEEELRELIARRDEKEKHLFISRFENLTPEEKAMVKMNQKLGLKEWAISGKQVYAYDPEQYDRDREQRIEMGIQDYLMGGDQMAGPADGYDTAQIQEDDY